MIKTETVLTATPVGLSIIPKDFSLNQVAGPVIQGLDAICHANGVYELNDIATELPEVTKEDSQHDIIMNEATSNIASAIRLSLDNIKKYIVPSCDVIEKAIKNVGAAETTENLIFSKLFLNFTHIGNEFFDSPVFPESPDPLYEKGVLFDTRNFSELGDWPKLSYVEILDIIPEVRNYPEFNQALSDENAVLQAWEALGSNKYWLTGAQKEIDVRRVSVVGHLNSLIVLALLVNKFASMEDPFKGVTNISLDDYRERIQTCKRFLNTVLYYTRARLQHQMAAGFAIVDKDVKYEECTEKESPFFGEMVLNGGCRVLYNDTVAQYFAASAEYSLSETVVGLLVGEFNNYIKPATTGFIDNVPNYYTLAKQYINRLSIVIKKNKTVSIDKAVSGALSELANSPIWSEFLSEEGKYTNLRYRFEERIRECGGVRDILTAPGVGYKIHEGTLSVANTYVAVVLAKVLDAPITAAILEKNISNTPLSFAEQRKTLAKAITHYVVKQLLTQQ